MHLLHGWIYRLQIRKCHYYLLMQDNVNQLYSLKLFFNIPVISKYIFLGSFFSFIIFNIELASDKLKGIVLSTTSLQLWNCLTPTEQQMNLIGILKTKTKPTNQPTKQKPATNQIKNPSQAGDSYPWKNSITIALLKQV